MRFSNHKNCDRCAQNRHKCTFVFDKYKFRLQSNLKIFENHIVVRNKNDIRVSKRMFVRFYKMIQQYQIKIKREKNFFLKSQLIQIIHELHDLRFVIE